MSAATVREKSDSTSSGADKADNACVVCFKDVEIYSIGECDHPVCYECSTRMRVLCQQLECPICRHALGKVVFAYDKLPYRQLEAKNPCEYYNMKYKISFYTKSIQQAFYTLLDHPCPMCDHPVFRRFEGLCNHVRRKHDLFYCDLCTDNLKIFSFERRCYTKAELSMHQRTGDVDNKSHRGHPLCEYCDTRYLDRDELFRHLRKDHYFCHFCDADGFNEFYKDYNSLKEHFRKDHFLCEEGDCAKEEFTGAFRDEIDYKAHFANAHGQLLNKQQAKQTRTLKLEITLGPRGRSGQTEPHASLRSRGRNDNNPEEPENTQSVQPQRALEIDARNEQEFPSLGGAAPSTLTLMHPPMGMRARMGSAGLARTKENFPALGGADSGGGGPSGSGSRPKQTSISSVIKKNAPSSSNAGMVIHVSNRPSTSTGPANKKPNASNISDFPSLPGTSKAAVLAAYQEDLIPSNSNINFNSVSAKHRQLMDDYVSVANPRNFQKIQLVQKEAEEARAKKAASTPKLDSPEFPALALGSKPSTQIAPSWNKPQKQRETEQRKSKIAPAPLLNQNLRQKNSSKYAQNGNSGNNSNASITTTDKDSSKKEKKNKNTIGDGKKTPEAKNVKQKKENNNNENKPAIANVACESLVNGNADACQTEFKLPEFNTSAYVPRVVGPPPGFGTTIKPPPGFQNVTLNSVAKLPNNLTFTSSLGENYNIVPTIHSYIQPPESVTRNQKLVGHFKEALRTPEALEKFRQISLKFREGTYKAQPYYEHCQSALKDKFETIFPELLSLLPDITKQQALYLVHSQHLKSMSGDQKKLLPNLEVCSICKQVLLSSDADYHNKLHALRTNFPTLGNSSCNKGNTLTTSRK